MRVLGNLHHLRFRVVESLLPPRPVADAGDVQQAAVAVHFTEDKVHGLSVSVPVPEKEFRVVREENIVICPDHGPHVICIRALLAQGRPRFIERTGRLVLFII